MNINKYTFDAGVDGHLSKIKDHEGKWCKASDVEKLLAKLHSERDELKNLLNATTCPQCNGGGAYYDQYGEVCQCQWCHELLKYKDSLAELQAKAVEQFVTQVPWGEVSESDLTEYAAEYADTLRNQAGEEG